MGQKHPKMATFQAVTCCRCTIFHHTGIICQRRFRDIKDSFTFSVDLFRHWPYNSTINGSDAGSFTVQFVHGLHAVALGIWTPDHWRMDGE